MRHWSDAIVVPQLFSPHTCNVSLDNILGGKRRRATTAELAFSSPQKTPRNSRTPRSRSETPASNAFIYYVSFKNTDYETILFISQLHQIKHLNGLLRIQVHFANQKSKEKET